MRDEFACVTRRRSCVDKPLLAGTARLHSQAASSHGWHPSWI